MKVRICFHWRPRRDSNPCYRRERAMSWASRRRGRKAAAAGQGGQPRRTLPDKGAQEYTPLASWTIHREASCGESRRIFPESTRLAVIAETDIHPLRSAVGATKSLREHAHLAVPAENPGQSFRPNVAPVAARATFDDYVPATVMREIRIAGEGNGHERHCSHRIAARPCSTGAVRILDSASA
jgi:hypothetical protein